MNEALRKKINDDIDEGFESEMLFLELIEKDGYYTKVATKSENIYEHWDVAIFKDNILDYVDVKGLKEATADGRTWVELQNVSGDIGWLYAPKLTIIAFEKEDCFELIKRVDLISVVEENIKKADVEDGGFTIYYDKTGLKDYRRYCRKNWGRDDRVVKVPFNDFQNLIFRRIFK